MKVQKNSPLDILLFTSFVVSVAMTPWINSDSLIIPKLVILFAGASFLSPRVFLIFQVLKKDLFSRLLTAVLLLYLVQLVLVIVNSDAPIEQQIYGRTGRGLGLITELSLLIFSLISIIFIKKESISSIIKFLLIACLVSTIYSIAQRFNLDIFDWNTRTNGIIGTLGNPNFQSSFAAISLVPALVYFGTEKRNMFKTLFLVLPLILVIYFAQSTQGYVASFISLTLYVTLYFWYKNKRIFYFAISGAFVSALLILQGILNSGPLSSFLYKYSIQSRGEMLRNSMSVAKDHPITGVGLDSLGDYYLMYKDQRTVVGVNEFTDHAHNSIVNYAATGGFPLATLHILIIMITLFSAISLIIKTKNFDRKLIALICSWVCYLSQSIISPATIALLTWNSIFTGAIIGLYIKMNNTEFQVGTSYHNNNIVAKPVGIFLLFISLIITYPYFNVDKIQADSAKLGDINLAIKSATTFPESTLRYARLGGALVDAGLAPQALELGRSAAKFNPNAASAWGLILVNNLATQSERELALMQLKRLDPTNIEIKNFIIP
jgi:hypothetical protein